MNTEPTYTKTITTTKTYKVVDVYNKHLSDLDLEGFEVLDFRPPAEGELFLDIYRFKRDTGYFCGPGHPPPRLILRKKPEPQVVRGNTSYETTVADVYGDSVTIPEGWSFVAFRYPIAREWYLSNAIANSGTPVEANGKYYVPRIIVEQTK